MTSRFCPEAYQVVDCICVLSGRLYENDMVTSGRLVYHIVHMLFLIGRLHLGESTAQNDKVTGGRLVYHL